MMTHYRRASNKPLGANRVDSSKVAALAPVDDDAAERFFSGTHQAESASITLLRRGWRRCRSRTELSCLTRQAKVTTGECRSNSPGTVIVCNQCTDLFA